MIFAMDENSVKEYTNSEMGFPPIFSIRSNRILRHSRGQYIGIIVGVNNQSDLFEENYFLTFGHKSIQPEFAFNSRDATGLGRSDRNGLAIKGSRSS